MRRGVFGLPLMHVTRLLGGYTLHAAEQNAEGQWVLVCRPSVAAPRVHEGEADCKRCLRALAKREQS